MADALTTKSAHDLIKRAVTTLGTGELAKKVVAPTDAAFELARQTAVAAQGGKGAAVITSIEVAVNKGSGGVKSPPVRFGFASREPIDSGPKPRVPIACGGGSCYTVCAFGYCVTVCIEWECPKKA